MASTVPLVLIYNSSGPHLIYCYTEHSLAALQSSMKNCASSWIHMHDPNTRKYSHTCTRILQCDLDMQPEVLGPWRADSVPAAPPRWWQHCGRADKSLRHPSTYRCCSGTRAIQHSRGLQIHKGTWKQDDILRPRPLENTPRSGVLLAHLST